jgi:hypothetical protein
MYNKYWNRFPIAGGDNSAAFDILDTDTPAEIVAKEELENANSNYASKLVLAAVGGGMDSFPTIMKPEIVDGEVVDSDTALVLPDDNTIYPGLHPKTRTELAKKSSVYSTTYMYVIHELEDAVQDCYAGDILNNDLNPGGTAPKAWDEGWAFYVGVADTLNPEGIMSFVLAEKRCKDFKVCSGNTHDGDKAIINEKLLNLYERGFHFATQARCDELKMTVKEIEVLMKVPNLQGMLKYLYTVGMPVDDAEKALRAGYPDAQLLGSSDLVKASGEAWAFLAAVIPEIHSCSPTVAADLRQKLDLGHGIGNAGDSSSYGEVKSQLPYARGFPVCPFTHPSRYGEDGGDSEEDRIAEWLDTYHSIQSLYPCMGITCADVGGKYNSVDDKYVDNFGPCHDLDSGAVNTLTSDMYTWCEAGEYKIVSDGTGSCAKCPAGMASSALGAGYATPLIINPCKECPAGTSSEEGSSECTTCSKDTYSVAGAASCTACPTGSTAMAGTSAVDSGATTCVEDVEPEVVVETVVEKVEVETEAAKDDDDDDDKNDDGMIIGLAVAAVFGILAVISCVYAYSMKGNYDKLMSEKAANAGIKGSRV